jgi:hypothetical protein
LAEEVPVKYSWTAPTYGSTVKEYRVEMRFGQDEAGPYGPWGEMGTTTDLSYIFSFTKGLWYQVRVRAQDQGNIQGPYSPPSVAYSVPLDPEEEPGNDLDPLPPEDIKGPIEVGGGSD